MIFLNDLIHPPPLAETWKLESSNCAPSVLQPRVCPWKIPLEPSHCPLAPSTLSLGDSFSTLSLVFSTVAFIQALPSSIGLSGWQSELFREASNKRNSPRIVKVGDKQRSFSWPAPLHAKCNGGGENAAEKPQTSLYKNLFSMTFSFADNVDNVGNHYTIIIIIQLL